MLIRKFAIGAGVVCLASGTFTQAQEKSSASESEPSGGVPLQEIVVTGTRLLLTNGNERPTPVTVVSTDSLLSTTPSSVVDGLNKLPIVANSSTPATTNSNGNYLNLRGFGLNRNLVLLDGHRLAPNDFNGATSADTIPQMLISRVEVVTGGASAVYGSDAVSGVVNFILDKKFDGVKLEGQAGLSTHGDAFSQREGIAVGHSFLEGRAHVEASFEHFHQNGLFDKNERPNGPPVYTLSGLGTEAAPFTLATGGRSPNFAFPGLILSGAHAFETFAPGGGSLRPFLPSDGGYGNHTGITADTRTDRGFARFDYDLSDNARFYVQGLWQQSRYENNFFPSFLLPLLIAPDNAYLPPALQGGDPFLFVRTLDSQQDNLHFLANDKSHMESVGLDLTFGQFVAHVNFDHSEASARNSYPNNYRYDHLLASMDAVDQGQLTTGVPNGQIACRAAILNPAHYSNCVPIDLFGTTPDSQRAALNYLHGESYNQSRYTMNVGQVNIAGPLFDMWAGPVQAAIGGEYRKLDLDVTANPSPTDLADCTGILLNCVQGTTATYQGGVIVPINKSENVKEGSVELDFPLLKDVAFAKSMNVNGAFRITDYSTSGSVTTWKFGGDWAVDDNLRLRVTRSRDIRAPNLYELYQPLAFGTTGYSDQHTGVQGLVIPIYSGGNPNLKPEVANTFTAGLVFTPQFINGLNFTVDYYRIVMDNAISTVSGADPAIQNICESSGGTSAYCALFERPAPFSDHSAANIPTRIFSLVENTAELKTWGIDSEVNYSFPAAGGRFNLRGLVGYQPELTNILAPGLTPQIGAGAASDGNAALGVPKWRVTAFASYSHGRWTGDVQERWRSSLRWGTDPTVVYAVPDVASVAYTDLSFTGNFFGEEGNRPLQVFLSIQNAFNKTPPVFLTAGSAGLPGFVYPAVRGDDVIGRYFTLGARLRF